MRYATVSMLLVMLAEEKVFEISSSCVQRTWRETLLYYKSISGLIIAEILHPNSLRCAYRAVKGLFSMLSKTDCADCDVQTLYLPGQVWDYQVAFYQNWICSDWKGIAKKFLDSSHVLITWRNVDQSQVWYWIWVRNIKLSSQKEGMTNPDI